MKRVKTETNGGEKWTRACRDGVTKMDNSTRNMAFSDERRD
ncbi:hypothetical protein SLEP1_g19055 [Rubroshorea leprosula]|nr:hypothetical protein SLEP1_g19055 [Rubroshorea leprosula]